MNFINIGIMAHVDAGKTTLTEGFLYHSAVKNQMGNVDKGTTTTDSMELEQKRGMTIKASTVSFHFQGTKINLIDTPGHMDFIAEVERSLSVLDGVILVISAKEGVQPQTRAIFHKLQALHIPTLFFLNKVDRLGVDLKAVYAQITSQLTAAFLPMQEADTDPEHVCLRELSMTDENLQETILLHSDRLLQKYTDNSPISEEEWTNELRSLTQKGLVYPLYHGAALRDIGIRKLLEAVVCWFTAKRQPSEQLSAYIYKVEWDEHQHKKCYFRLFSGNMALRMRTAVSDSGLPLIIRNLYALENGRCQPAAFISQDDIGVLTDILQLRCGDFIGLPHEAVKPRDMAKPLLSVTVRPDLSADGTDRKKLLCALTQLAEEDPFLSLSLREGTDEIVLHLFGHLQQEILQSLLTERYRLAVLFDPMTPILKETPKTAAQAQILISDRDNLHNAGIVLRIEPLPAGSGFVYETKVSYGYLQKPFQNAVLEGIETGLKEGLIHHADDLKVTFADAQYDSVMSTPADYRRLAPQVVKRALSACGVFVTEPILTYCLTAPCGCEKAVISGLLRIQAVLEDISYTETELRIKGIVPLRTTFGFAVDLMSITDGKGLFETCFLEYRKMEPNVF